MDSSPAISAFDIPRAISRSTSRSRPLNRLMGAVCAPAPNDFTSDRITAGNNNESPAAAVRTACTISSGRARLSRKPPAPAHPPLQGLRRLAGHGVALVMAPYLLLKIAWALGLFLPAGHMGEAGWRMVNAATVVLAAIAILLAMAFSRPWGERLPAPPVVLPAWAGTACWFPRWCLHRCWTGRDLRPQWPGTTPPAPPKSGPGNKCSS